MDDALRWIDAQADAMARLVIDFANINSGTHNLSGLAKMLAALEAEFSSLGELRRIPLAPSREIDSAGNIVESPLGEVLVITKNPNAALRVLLCIHYDTVYDEAHPFHRAEIAGDVACGPGVIDAKGGIVVMLFALRAFMRSPLANSLGWEMVLNPDEEIGSPGSANLLREAATRNHVGLVFEPAMSDGSLVGARKGSGTFTAVIRGRAAHAGRDFAAGRSAIVAAADLVMRLEGIREDGVTINCGKIEGGGAVNIVPDLAIARFNIRVSTQEQQHAVEARIREEAGQVARREGIRVEIHGGFSSPPKPLDPRSAQLLDQIIATAGEIGLNLNHVPSGGTCDGNKLAAAGLPVVDSLGPVGGELHSDREFLHLPSLAERAKLTALVLVRLASGEIAPATIEASR